jgi:hypothetical protein
VLVPTGVIEFLLGAMRNDLVLPYTKRHVNANARMAIGLAVLAIGLAVPWAIVWLADTARECNLWR